MCYSALIRTNLKFLKSDYGARIDPQQFELFAQATVRDPKHYRPITQRIFPDTSYAPVLYVDHGALVIAPMRYGVYLPPAVHAWWARRVEEGKRHGKKLGTKPTNYNARRNNLASTYWDTAFMHHHGFVVMDGFYENVMVRDLIGAGVITLAHVTAYFAAKSRERMKACLAKGKKYTPTRTEQIPAIERSIEIFFQPHQPQPLLVPVIWNATVRDDGFHDKGFALVTDEPLPEVAAAGHDRTPIFLRPEDAMDWVQPASRSAAQWDAILEHGRHITFDHAIAHAA